MQLHPSTEMRSKIPGKKSSKGSVVVFNSHESLQLRFRFGGKRHYISLGHFDIPFKDPLGRRKTNRERAAYAELKAAEIEQDILKERFDNTLEKYKSASDREKMSYLPLQKKPQLGLDELWKKYSEFKKPQASPSTYVKDFKRHRNHILDLPTRSINEASAIRDWLLEEKTVDTAKRCLTQFKACCQWSMEEGLIETNPFALMTIQLPKGSGEDADINPFTKEERDLIIRTVDILRASALRVCNPLKRVARVLLLLLMLSI